MSYTHRVVVVPAAFQQLAQGLCEAAAEGDAGNGMFTTGLSPGGTAPAHQMNEPLSPHGWPVSRKGRCDEPD